MNCNGYMEADRQYQEKKDKESQRTKEITEHFSNKVPERVKEFVINEVFKENFIFVRKEKETRNIPGILLSKYRYFGYCTRCHKEFEIDPEEMHKRGIYVDGEYRHNYEKECPECGSKCLVKYEKYKRSTMYSTKVILTFDKSQIDKEVLIARGFAVSMDYSGEYKNVKPKFDEITRYVFDHGVSTALGRPWYGFEWYKSDNCISFKNGHNNLESYVDYGSIDSAVKDTQFKYSPYKLYEENYLMSDFFYRYNQYPVIEQLIKIGFRSIADAIVTRQSLRRSVNWKQKNVFKFLGLNKGEVKELRNEYGDDISPALLRTYKFSKEEKLKWTLEEVRKRKDIDIDKLKKVKKYIGINKFVNYCEKQKCREYPYRYKVNQNISTWIDYINDCKRLKMNLKDKSVLMPKDLYKAHQKTIEKVKYEENKIYDRKIVKRAKEKASLIYETDKFIIRPAESSKELIDEGNILHHCVGGYAGRVAEGKTNIFFIRDKKYINKPLVTVEISNKNTIIQVRANRNKEPEEDVKKFVEEYKEKVLKKKK